MTRSLRLLPLVLLFGCGKDLEETGDPPEDTDTDTDTDTDIEEEPTIVENCPILPAAPAGATVVQPGDDLAAVLAGAKSGDVIALATGTHNVTSTLVLDKPGITLRSQSGNPEDVILKGILVPDMIHVTASDVTIAGLTLQDGGGYGILVKPVTGDVNDTIIENVRVHDMGREFVSIGDDGTGTWFADGGEVRCSEFVLSAAGRKKVVGMCETGGIKIHRAADWTVRDNHIEGFWCAFADAGWGIEASEGSRNVVIERNVLHDTVHGIALGRGQLKTERIWEDPPCEGTPLQAIDGIVRNNIVFSWERELFESAEVKPRLGITVENSCNATVLHNTIYSKERHTEASLLMRFANTTGVVANNLTNGTVRRQDDAKSVVSTNIEHTGDNSFMHLQKKDLRLAPAAYDLIDQADPEHTVADDFEGQLREDGLPDIGADER